MALAGRETPRPMTFKLMAQLLDAAGSVVESVGVTRLAEEIFYATIRLRLSSGDVLEIDARPSDALGLAQRTGAPIYVAEDILETQGIAADGLPASLADMFPAEATEAEIEWLSMQEMIRANK
jgi:bifunctional DNase/RNase